ncbi:acyclic terpene utilization AtuA family protein [Neobacillus vireti]|uniref:acyclic terpene utilization AtuA family protein n=1 Tax=Neobacillus vireti TaxID=220686 RepID=UPI002FFE8E11
MKSIRIAAGAGFAGDRIEPALDNIIRGNVDYIIFECLAERTIALAQKEKHSNPDIGYNHLLEYRMDKVIPLLKDHPVKVITNMGAANPIAAAKKIYEIACENGLNQLKIAAVSGDDVLSIINNYSQKPMMETGAKLETIRDNIISANAYIGGQAISTALAEGADIVVTGRAADPSLATGPIMQEFGRSYSDYEFLGKTVAAGHLLECAGQLTGGYFADPGYKDVPELWNLAFPILTFFENGNIVVEKLPDTGGILNILTVKEQLLYEVQDPMNYITPDVVADFSNITVEELGDNKVLVKGAFGKRKTGSLKVSVGYLDGFIGEGEISYGGHNCVARAQLAEEVIKKRLEILKVDYKELRTDLIGINSLYGAATAQLAKTVLNEVRLRVSIRTDHKEAAEIAAREVESLYVNGPAGGGGARGDFTNIVSVASVLIPEEDVKLGITWAGGPAQ